MRRPERPAGRWTAARCVVVVLAASAAACTNGTSITTPFDTSPPVLRRGPVYELQTGQIAGLGTVVVDGHGITLYTYATDQRGRPSRCSGICAVQWPPFVLPPGVDRPLAGRGIREALLGTAPRADGSVQVTYDGWPLYTWPPDRAPGQATGQALTNAGGLWYVQRPDGTVVVTPA